MGTTDILKIGCFDIIGLNEVGKEVIMDDYSSFIVKDDQEKITYQLLYKKKLKAWKLWCSDKGDFIAVEIGEEEDQGCIIVVNYINPNKHEWREDTLESLNELIFGMKDKLNAWKKIIMGDFNFDFWEKNYKKEKNKRWAAELLNLKNDLMFKSVKDFSHCYKNGGGIS